VTFYTWAKIASYGYYELVSAGEHLQIGIRVERDTAVLSLHGELDLVNAPLLDGEISSPAVSGAAMVVLDLEGLRFIDSTGLRAILSAHTIATERGQEFAVTPGVQQVKRLLRLTRIDDHLRVIAPFEQLPVAPPPGS
jgi:anti-anti-sigma factor